mgnify:FL=1
MLLLLLLLCGCSQDENKALNSETRFLLDTACTVSADCDDETLSGAFAVCGELERLLSRTVKGSDVYRLNETDGFVSVSDDTLHLLEKSVYYGNLTDGKFDITVCPVSELWDFKNQIVPNRSEIAEALKSVDYHSIEIKGNTANLNGKKIDLGGIAKGYIADKVISYLEGKGVKKALVNLGGNIKVTGKFNIGIRKPFTEEILLNMPLENKSAVTSGIYERYIEKDGEIYHHVLDPATGCGVKNELSSVTVIGENSADCDALSTACLLLGTEKGKEIIENTAGTEAVFISREGDITLTAGLYRENDKILFKR